MVYDANVAALQSTVNRFSSLGGFAQLVVDGAWGPRTQQGTYAALAVIAHGTCASAGCPSDEDQNTAESLVAKWDGTGASARGMQTFFAGVADDMGLAHVASKPPTTGGGTFPTSSLPPNPFSSSAGSIVDAWNRLPLWQRVGVVVAAGVGLLWTRKQLMTSKRKGKR